MSLTVIVFVVLSGGAILGAGIRNTLHSSQLDESSREVIKLGTGLLGTLAALVLGLLIASAKSAYDTQLNQVRKLTAAVDLLDLLPGQFGPEAHEARDLLQRAIDPTNRVGESVAKEARGGMRRLTRATARRAPG